MPLLLFLNLGGLLSAVAIAAAIGVILALGPDFVEPAYGDIAISLVVLAVGGAMEFTPLRPRFIYLPLWFIGAGMTIWHTSKLIL